MAPTENAVSVNTKADGSSLKPEEKPLSFRSQYHELNRSTSNRSSKSFINLASRFEKLPEPEVNNNLTARKVRLLKKGEIAGEKQNNFVYKKSLTQAAVSRNSTEWNSSETKRDSNEIKTKKRVSFSADLNPPPPVPKPRLSLQVQQVTVEAKVIKPERTSVVETVIIHEPPTPEWDKIEFADPEDRHNIIRNNTEVGSIENIKKTLDSFTMETKKNKRNPSFRSKWLTIFSKDKDKEKDKKSKDKDENKKTKKTENAVFADNAQNENFNRHSTQRHTIDTPRHDTKREINHQQTFNDEMHPDQKDIEHRYAAMHIHNFTQARNSFVNGQQNPPQQHHQQLLRKLSQEHDAYSPQEDYVFMENKNETKNFINHPKYDSSSTNTIESENSSTSVNPLQQLQQERMAIRSKFFTENASPRAQETQAQSQNVQLVSTKAAIPINSERPLPNPYQQQIAPQQPRNLSPYHVQQQTPQNDENDLADSGYGTVYERNRPMSAGSSDISATSMNSPRSPSVERTKLKLPPNREKIELQPRLKSPIPANEISTDKLIATELLKPLSKKVDKKDRNSPSHQKLQLEIDYPNLDETICGIVGAVNDDLSLNDVSKNNELSITSIHKNDVSSSTFNSSEHSSETVLESGDWQRVQKINSPTMNSVQITTNALVHVDPSQRVRTPSQDGRSRSVTPVMMSQRNSSASLQRSPPKHEIRQTVEAFCWKELKKLKEKEDIQMQMLVGPMVSSCGYNEDPIRRSRSMAVTPRDTKRSTSLPREVRQKRPEDVELNARRMAQQQRFNLGPQRNGQTRPIFNRGSLTQQNAIDQPIYSKKVSFRSQNRQESAWPTKNGFTQSPPQRRLDAEGNKERESLEDDVFIAPVQQQQQNEALPSRDEIFLLNQQRQKELLLAKAQRCNAPVSVDGGSIADNASVISEVPPMRNLREPIYGTRPTVMNVGKPVIENIYGTRNNPHDMPGRVMNEAIYGTKNSAMARPNESLYGSRNPSPNGPNVQNRNESLYAARSSESPYGTRQFPSDPYGSRPPGASRNDSIYGTRTYPQVDESPYGSKPLSQEPIYGRRPQPGTREQIYGTRQIHAQDQVAHNVAQRFLPGYPPPGYQEYAPRVMTASNGEPVYGYRVSNGSVRGESPYGSQPPSALSGQHYLNRPRLPPANAGPPLPPGHPSKGNTPVGLRRSNSLRQPESPESLYSGRANFNKPPSGAQFRPRQNVPNDIPLQNIHPNIAPSNIHPLNMRGQDTQGRYDIPPHEFPQPNPHQIQRMPEPIYGHKVNTVSNKVYDMYGNIYEAGKVPNMPNVPMSPPPLQKAGVLYGQLQRNSNAQPMVYQSHQQLQPNQFQRGTRLTASVNDVHRYNSINNVAPIQRTDPPSRPLPPIPDEQQEQQQQKKSRFGFGRKKTENKGK